MRLARRDGRSSRSRRNCFGGSDIAAISEFMAEATFPTFVFPRVVATNRDVGVVDLVAVVAGDTRGIMSLAINHN